MELTVKDVSKKFRTNGGEIETIKNISLIKRPGLDRGMIFQEHRPLPWLTLYSGDTVLPFGDATWAVPIAALW